MNQLTAFIIKPNATAAHHVGEILSMVEKAGFEIIELRLFNMDSAFADRFYDIHRGKPFFPTLMAFMTSGASIAAVLSREDAVNALRTLVGATDPAQANPGTIRQRFGQTVTINAVHASDSETNALREIGLLFPSFAFPV